MAWRTGSGTAGIFTPGGAWIVPCSGPTAKVRALILVRVLVDWAGGADSAVAVSPILDLLASCMPDWMWISGDRKSYLDMKQFILTYTFDTALFPSARVPKSRFILAIDTGAAVLLLWTALATTTPTPLSCPSYIVKKRKKKLVSNTSFMANIMTAFSSPDVPALSIGTVLVEVTDLVPLLTTLDTLKLDNNSKNNGTSMLCTHV